MITQKLFDHQDYYWKVSSLKLLVCNIFDNYAY